MPEFDAEVHVTLSRTLWGAEHFGRLLEREVDRALEKLDARSPTSQRPHLTRIEITLLDEAATASAVQDPEAHTP